MSCDDFMWALYIYTSSDESTEIESFSIINVNVNVNVHVDSPDIPMSSAKYLIYTSNIVTHSFDSVIASEENSAFVHYAATIVNHYNVAFSFHQVQVLLNIV